MVWMKRRIFFFFFFLLSTNCWCEGRDARSVKLLAKCVQMADPLVHTPEYVFPLSDTEIKEVCRMWDGFTDCVRNYTKSYLSTAQQKDFNAAIQPSMNSIHRLCAEDPEYRTEYLSNAPCMKKVSIEGRFCGNHYRYMVDLLEGSSSSDDLLCCAHHRFRTCVAENVERLCDGGANQGKSTSAFITELQDRALGFLLQQCRNYRPAFHKCPGPGDPPNRATTLQDETDPSLDLTSRRFPPSPSSSLAFDTTRFTWTTPTPAYRNTTLWGQVDNRLDGPESQQYRGRSGAPGGSALSPALLLSWGLCTVIYLA